MTSHLCCGDTFKVLRDSFADDSVDLIRLDPPFHSNASHIALVKGPPGNQSAAQVHNSDRGGFTL